MSKTIEALKLAEEAAEFARNMCLGMNWSTDLPDEALAAIREVLAESKPAPDGRIPKTVFTLDDISKAAEMGRQAGMIDALAEPVKPQKERQDFIDGYTAGMADAKRMQANAEPVKQQPVAWYDKIKGMEVSVDVSTGEDDDYYRVFGRVDGVMLESCGAQNDIILVIEESRNFAAPVAMSQAEQDKQEPVAWDLAEKVRRDLDRQSCPDAYMRIAIESIVKHFPAPPPVQEITEAVDAAMVEMKNIYPPLRRSECERLIRAAKYAAPVSAPKQEPVAHHKDAPHTIYLQTGCDDPEDCECSFNEWGDTTWCTDQIHDTDIPYIRADYAAPVDAKAIRAEALEQAAKVCEQGTGDAVQTDVLKALWKERERIAEVIRGLK